MREPAPDPPPDPHPASPDPRPASGSRPPSEPLPGPERSPAPEISIVVPAYDEADNMPELFNELARAIRSHELDAEVVLVDDGSVDGTLEAARRAAASVGLERVKLLRHRRNRGKTEALVTASREAEGRYLVLFDADLQHSAEEIPRFVAKLEADCDVVAGRKVGRYEKRFVSSVYNWVCRRLFGVPVHDLNAMKAFRREVLEGLQLRSDWHRYLVVLAHARGYRVEELEIRLYPRRHGISKYRGGGRILVGSLDLLSVWFQLAFSRKPMLLFGVTGLSLLALGGLTGAVALYLRFGLERGYRPLLTLVVLLVVVGLLLFAVGFLAELIASLRAEVEELRRERRG